MTRSPASGRQEIEARLLKVGGQPDDEIDLGTEPQSLHQAAVLLQRVKACLN